MYADCENPSSPPLCSVTGMPAASAAVRARQPEGVDLAYGAGRARHDHGVAQINQIHRAYVEQLFDMPMEESMSDPTLNLRFAYLLYSDIAEGGGCGWKPWRLC